MKEKKGDENGVEGRNISLPTLYCFTDALKDFSCQTLCQVVCKLISGTDGLNLHGTILYILPEEVPFDIEVFGTGCNALIGCKGQGSIVVFKYNTSTVEDSFEVGGNFEDFNNLATNVDKGNGCTKRST